MISGNEVMDKIVHLTTHTTRIKYDATVKSELGLNFASDHPKVPDQGPDTGLKSFVPKHLGGTLFSSLNPFVRTPQSLNDWSYSI